MLLLLLLLILLIIIKSYKLTIEVLWEYTLWLLLIKILILKRLLSLVILIAISFRLLLLKVMLVIRLKLENMLVLKRSPFFLILWSKGSNILWQLMHLIIISGRWRLLEIIKFKARISLRWMRRLLHCERAVYLLVYLLFKILKTTSSLLNPWWIKRLLLKTGF